MVVEPHSDLMLQVGMPDWLPVAASVLDHGPGWVIWLRWELDEDGTWLAGKAELSGRVHMQRDASCTGAGGLPP